MSLCFVAGGKAVTLAVTAFTLSWTHSVEKTEWHEAWEITPAGLHLTEAKVKGSGAGMDPPPGSVLKDGWWIYRPKLAAQRSITLAASGATGGGWTLCADGECRELGKSASGPLTLSDCTTP